MNDRLAELQDEDVGDIDTGQTDVAWSKQKDAAGNNGIFQAKKKANKKRKVFSSVRKRTKKSPATNNTSNHGSKSPSEIKYMKQFFQDIENIKLDISIISDATDQIVVLKDKAVLATGEAEESVISETIRTLVDQTNGRAKQCKNLLCLLKEENDSMKKEKRNKLTEEDTSKIRVRENLVNTLLHKFINEVKRYQDVQEQYKSDIKKKVTRQIKIIQPDATEEEVDQIMRSEGGREALIQQQILHPDMNDKIRNEYRVVADKYQDIILIEASVAELHQMFLDFALLTEQQGEVLDDIEYNVKSAADHVEIGNEDIHKAIQYQKKVRKKRCFILLIVVGVIVIILLGSGLIL